MAPTIIVCPGPVYLTGRRDAGVPPWAQYDLDGRAADGPAGFSRASARRSSQPAMRRAQRGADEEGPSSFYRGRLPCSVTSALALALGDGQLWGWSLRSSYLHSTVLSYHLFQIGVLTW